MIESFIITFRETLEAALVVGIVLTYLRKTGRTQLLRHVYVGVGLALLASVIGAVVLQMLYQGQETRGQQLFEGSVMTVAAAFVTTMVLWMWKAARTIRKDIEAGIDQTQRKGTAVMAGLGILAFVFLMVFREGAETVLFLYAISFGADILSNLAGGILGVALAVVFGVLISRGSLLVDLRRFFRVTGALLLFIVVELLATAIHEFQEARVMSPASTGIFWDVQIWLASPVSSLLTLLPIVIVPCMMLFFMAKSREGSSREEMRSHLLVKSLSGFLTLFVIIFTISGLASQVKGYAPEPLRVSPVDGMIRIPAESITGNITKYAVSVDGVDVRFLLVRASDGTIRSALDACRICGPKGFEQVGDTLVCRRCYVETAIDDIGKDESCNPIPLDVTIGADGVIIPTSLFLKDMYIWTDY